jgi:hypothetical protein
MLRRRLCTLVALALALVASVPAKSTERPFEVFALTTAGSLGPGETLAFPVQVVRYTETCTMCTAGSTTCCTGAIRLTFDNVPAGVRACFPVSNAECVAEITADSPAAIVQADSTIAPGTYTLRLRASANDGPNPRSHSAEVPLTLLPFSIDVPSSASLLPGGSQSMPLSIARIAAGTGTIEFALVSPNQGLSGTFNPNPAGGDQSTLQLGASPGLPTGNYFPIVRAALGTVVRNYDMNVAVAPSFSLSLSPAKLALAAGGSAQVAVKLERGAGLKSAITLSLVAPRGFTGTFSSPRDLGPRTLRLSVARNVVPGNYHAVVRGSSGNITRNVGLRMHIRQKRPGLP